MSEKNGAHNPSSAQSAAPDPRDGCARDQVRSVECFITASGGAKDWVFVKVTTHEGVVGWGECYTGRDRERAIKALVDAIGRYLVDRDLFAIRHFRTVALADIARKRGSMEFHCALSGIEMAMLDAVGKLIGQPVHRLLGGPFRSRIRVYANGWSYNKHGGTTDGKAAAQAALEQVGAGFTALKFDPFVGPWRTHPDTRAVHEAVERFAAVRDAVGPAIDLLVETHRRLNTQTAIKFARLLEPYAPYWLEEPVPSSNLAGLREIKDSCTIPIVTGEDLYTATEIAAVCSARAADILNPDVAACGGIIELVHMAAVADAHQIMVSPHNYNSTTAALAATVQASAVMPNFALTEYFVNFASRSAEIASPLKPTNGYIALPTRPGLGIDMDEDAIRAFEPDPNRPLREIPHHFEEA